MCKTLVRQPYLSTSQSLPRLKSDVAAAVLAADDPENRFLRPPYRQLMPNEVPAAWSGDLRIIRHALGNRVAGFVPWSSWSFQSLKKNSGNLSIFEKFVVWTVTSNAVARSAPSFARRPVDSFLLPGSGYHGFPLKRQAWYLWPYPGIRKKLVQTVQQHMSHSTLQKPWTIEFGYFLLLYSTLTKSHCWIELHKQLDFKWYFQILHKVMCVCVFFSSRWSLLWIACLFGIALVLFFIIQPPIFSMAGSPALH